MAEPTPDDVNAIRGVILAQLAAFAADDAERAFSFVSAGVRERFGASEAFLAMVRADYPKVYQARAALFQEYVHEHVDGGVTVYAHLYDGAGHQLTRCYRACFELCRDEGGWRISACMEHLLVTWHS